MKSAGDNKNDASTPPKFTMRTRRQVAEEKRKAEEDIDMAKEAKKRKEMYEPRENEDVKPQDLIVDPKLLKIYIGHVEGETEVKQEVVLEDSEGEEVNLEGWDDGGFHQDEEMEELVSGSQQHNVENEDKGVQTEDKGLQAEEKGVQVEEKGVQVEEKGVQVDEKGVQVEEKGVQVDEKGVQVEEKGVQVEEKGNQVEDKGVQVEDKGVQVEDKGVQVEDKGVQVEDKGVQVYEKGVQVEGKGVQIEDKIIQTEDKDVQTKEIITEYQKKIAMANLTLDKVFQTVLPMLNQKDVFRCRRVNKQWRQMQCFAVPFTFSLSFTHHSQKNG